MVSESDEWVSRREHEREVEELRRSNRRLSGTLDIVLETLAVSDVSTLFTKVLEKLTNTMDAWGALFYTHEPNGFHLCCQSEALSGVSLTRYIPFPRTLDELSTRASTTLRLRVLPPTKGALRLGRLSMREVVDEATEEIHNVGVEALPPFASFYAVPVWFGNSVIGLIEVGWDKPHFLSQDDADLLDAIARYLSIQLVGAVSAMRSQRTARLHDVSSQIREELLCCEALTDDVVNNAFERAAFELGAQAAVLRQGASPNALGGDLPLTGSCELPMGLSSLVRASDERENEVSVISLEEGTSLSVWLEERGEPCIGALLDAGIVEGERRACLFLRDLGEEPFDDIDLAFLTSLARDIVRTALGDEVRSKERHISQALQRGMKNELQEVEGISAEGSYNSATKSALVGGDFYELVRLSSRHGFVVMGDVSGKGVEAASVSAACKTALTAYAWEGLGPAHMAQLLNDFLLSFSQVETFATLFVGLIDLERATLIYCSAGHPPAMLLRSARHELQLLEVQSGVVGAFSEMNYKNGVAELEEGDILLLYTDGTTEARARDGHFFGEDGLKEAIMSKQQVGVPGLCQALLSELASFTGQRLEDDVALVALRFDEVGEQDIEGTQG